MHQSSDPRFPGAQRRRAIKSLVAAGAALSVGGGWPALAGAADTVQPRRGGRLRVGTANQSMTDSLDPAKATHTADYSRLYMFYSGLSEFDSDYSVRNALAESFDSSDYKTWQVKLRTGVHFHDGKPFTADDVVFSLMRHKDPATASKAKSIADGIASVKAAAPDRVEIVLTEANVDLPALLATPHFVIVAAGTADFSKGNGTGPFICKTFIPGGNCIGARNPDFWKPGAPYLDEVELIGILDDAARINALLSGDVQLVSPIPARYMSRVQQSGRAELLLAQSSLYTDLILRQDAATVNNPDFVLAIKHLHDRQRIQKTLLGGQAEIANDHPVPAWHPYFLPGLPQRAFDLDKARFHIKQGNLAGASAKIVVPPSIESAMDSAVLLQQAAGQAGLKLQVRRVPTDGYWSSHWMKHPISYGSILPRPTLDVLYSQFFQSSAPWNETGWQNPRFDQLLLLARKEHDEARRKQLYGDMQTLIYERNSLVIPVFLNFIDGRDKRVKGLAGSPSGRLMGYRFAEFAWLDPA